QEETEKPPPEEPRQTAGEDDGADFCSDLRVAVLAANQRRAAILGVGNGCRVSHAPAPCPARPNLDLDWKYGQDRWCAAGCSAQQARYSRARGRGISAPCFRYRSD